MTKNGGDTGRLPMHQDSLITKKRQFFVCLIAATSTVMQTRTVTLCVSVPRDKTQKKWLAEGLPRCLNAHDCLVQAFNNYSRCLCSHPCHCGKVKYRMH